MQRAAVALGDDIVTHAEAESGAGSRGFGREKGLEDLLSNGFWNFWTVVTDPDLDPIVDAPGRDNDLGASPRTSDDAAASSGLDSTASNALPRTPLLRQILPATRTGTGDSPAIELLAHPVAPGPLDLSAPFRIDEHVHPT